MALCASGRLAEPFVLFLEAFDPDTKRRGDQWEAVCQWFLAGLRARAWHGPEHCVWLAPLHDHFAAIRQELLACYDAGWFAPTGPDAEHETQSGWALLRFLMQRVLYDDHLEACPQVVKYLQYLQHLQSHFRSQAFTEWDRVTCAA